MMLRQDGLAYAAQRNLISDIEDQTCSSSAASKLASKYLYSRDDMVLSLYQMSYKFVIDPCDAPLPWIDHELLHQLKQQKRESCE